MDTTWDGTPVSRERPHGCTVVVWRRSGERREFLILHRRHAGPPGFEADWAWTPPSGARLPGEALLDAARRELREETGFDLSCLSTDLGDESWAVFVAEASPVAVVVLDDEHDRYEWLPASDAAAECLPAHVGETVLAAERLTRTDG